MLEEFGPAAGRPNPVTVVAVNGRQFVSGMYWQPLSRSRGYIAEAREIGKREGMDIVAIRESVPRQAGFVAKGQGALKGMYSLAAVLASEFEAMGGRACLAAFEVDPDDDLYGLVAVNDGAIMPGADIIGGRELILRKLREQFNQLPNWDRVYSPPSFGFGGDQLDLKQTLVPARLKREHRLRPLAFGLTANDWALSGVAVTVLVFGLGGWWYWRAQQAAEAAEAEARAAAERRAEIARLNANAKREVNQQSLDHPWSKQPAVEDMVRGCLDSIYPLPLVIEGWLLRQAKCTGSVLSVAYDRKDGGTVAEFLVAARRWFPTAPTVSDAGDGAAIDVPMELRVGGDDPLRPAAEATADLLSHFQRIAVSPNLAEKATALPAAPALPGQAAVAPQPDRAPEWRTFTFRLDTEMSPEPLFEGVRTDGVRITEMLVRLEAGAPKLIWSLSGELNAK